MLLKLVELIILSKFHDYKAREPFIFYDKVFHNRADNRENLFLIMTFALFS